MRRKFIGIMLCSCLLSLLLMTSAKAQKEELKLEILNGHSGGGVLSVAVSSDGKFALTGSMDWTTLLWDLETGKQLRRFVGHEAAVNAVAFSKDGRFVLTASADKTARLWETATGKPVVLPENRNGILKGHTGAILSAAISADGFFIATASEDKTARIWDASSGKQLFSIEHTGRVNSIAFSPDSRLLLTGGEDKIARLYDVKTGAFVRQFVGHIGNIKSVAYSPDGKQILTGSRDGTVRLWNIEDTTEIKNFGLRDDHSIYSVAFTPSGRAVIIGVQASYPYNSCQVWAITSGEKVWERKDIYNGGEEVWGTDSPPAPIAMTPDEERILVGGGISIQVLDVKGNEQALKLDGRTNKVNSIDVSPDSHFILTGGNMNTSGFWNLKSAQVYQRQLESKSIQDLTSKNTEKYGQQDVNFVYSSYNIGSNFVLEKPSNRRGVYVGDISGDSKAVAFSPDGNSFAFQFEDGVSLFDTATLKLKQIIGDGRRSFIKAIAFSPDGKFILTAQDSRIQGGTEAEYFNIKTGIGADFLKGHSGQINSVVFSPNGKTIATASDDKTVRLWNAETGEVKQIIKDFSAPVWSVAFSSDGKTIAAASGGEVDMSKIGIGNAASANSVQLWDVETGKEKESFGGEFKTFSNRITGFKSVAYSKDGKYIAAGSFDGKVYLRNNETKELRKLGERTEVIDLDGLEFIGRYDAINSVKFSADGKYVVSGSSDSTTRIWNAATGEEICKLVTFRDGTWAVVQSKTGRYDAPNGGEIDGINWVFGNETIALSQLKDIYYTPNLLPRLLGYNKEPLAEVPNLKNLKLFPKIVEQKLDEANARLTVKLQNRGGGIGAVQILVNGKQATADARDQKLKDNPNLPEAVVTFDLKGSAGFDPKRKNNIEVITSNYDSAIKKGYISSRGVEIVYLGNAADEITQPTLYAVVGGVSDYNGSQIDLTFAAKDAEDFANALGIGARRLFCPQENPNCTDKVKIKLLTTPSKDEKTLPTKANFKAAFAEIAREAKPEDVLVVYLSGHGASLTVNDTDTYFYLTQEADKASKEALEKKEYREAVTISSGELLDWLTQSEWVKGQKGIQALKQVMILDTCAAGAFEQKFSFQKTKDLSADQIRALERLKDRTGFQILMGSAADAVSYEASQYGQGLLTYALLQGMKGAKLRDGKFVDTQLLFGYAADTVPTIANGIGGIQKPRIFGATGIDIGLMNDKDKAAIKIESVKPFMLRPRFSSGAEADDPLNLVGVLSDKFKQASEIKSRGNGENEKSATLVYIDDGSLPGAYYVTGSYTVDTNGKIMVTPFLRKDGQTVAVPKELIIGKDAEEAAENLLQFVLKEIGGN